MKELTQQLTAKILATALLSVTTAAVAMGQSHSQGAPYDLEKFRSVLDDSKPVSYTHLTLPTIYSV